MDLEAGLKQILEKRASALPQRKGNNNWVYVMEAASGEAGTYKILEASRREVLQTKAGVAAVIHEWDAYPGRFFLKVIKRIFRSKKYSPKKGVFWYRLDDADILWLKGLRAFNRHFAGLFFENEVIAFTGATTVAELRREGLYTP